MILGKAAISLNSDSSGKKCWGSLRFLLPLSCDDPVSPLLSHRPPYNGTWALGVHSQIFLSPQEPRNVSGAVFQNIKYSRWHDLVLEPQGSVPLGFSTNSTFALLTPLRPEGLLDTIVYLLVPKLYLFLDSILFWTTLKSGSFPCHLVYGTGEFLDI